MTLRTALQSLSPSGPEGFEGLIQQLLSALTGYRFYLAQSGSQAGRDLATSRIGTVLAVECKRYGAERELDQTELLGKLMQAEMTILQLDVWVLVASRDVPEQLYSLLDTAGRRLGVDVQIIAAGDGSPSTLEVLCAHAPDAVLRHFRAAGIAVRGLQSELRRITEHEAFAFRRDGLRDAFSKNAGYESLRDRTAKLLVRQFASDVESRAAFGQPINIEGQAQCGRLVWRVLAAEVIEAWLSGWRLDHHPIAVLGEEGDGKTWAVASWLHAHLQQGEAFPPVLWIPSADTTEANWETLITHTLARRLGGELERWRLRLRRWCEGWQKPMPALVVVIDGLNERHDAVWWRPLLESADSSPWRQSCALMLTARTAFWPPLRRARHLEFEEYIVPPFSDGELEVALSKVGLHRKDVNQEVLSLVRKPRYFDLALQFRERLVTSGDITVARLIYEDWRDRYARRVLPLDDEAFQGLISKLAAEQRRHAEGVDRTRLNDAMAHIEQRQAALNELEMGGVLIRDGSNVRVEPRRLALGLGVVLAAELKKPGLHTTAEQRLAEWLEPHSDMDLKGAIVESAVLHAMISADYTTETRSALLAAWLTHRNMQTPSPYVVGAYLPNDPDAYFMAAECLWSDAIDDGVAQRALRTAFLRWRGEESLAPVFTRWLRRWLAFVHVDGSPVAVRPQDRGERRQKLEAALQRAAPIGDFRYVGRSFVGIEDEGLLRLGRLSLGLIAEGDRTQHAAALADAYVADSLMQFPEKADLLRWVIRTSSHPLDATLMKELQSIVDSGETAALKAAYWLAGAIGTAAALSVRDALPAGLFSRSPLWEKYEADPCGGGFAWPMEDCPKCIGRSDLPPHLLAQQVGRCAIDPNLTIPSDTCSRVEELVQGLSTQSLWSGPWLTETEHRFDTTEPTLARCNVPRWTGIIRQAARQVELRSGLSLRQLAYELGRYALVLSGTERSSIEAAWNRLVVDWTSLNSEDRLAESLLFELMLDWLSPEEQFRRLLLRPADADLLIRFRRHFKALAWQQMKRVLENGDPRTVTATLFFATSNQTAHQAARDANVLSLVTCNDPHLRALALQTMWIAGDPRDVHTIADGAWRARPDESSYWENHWGSLLLADRSELPYEELRSRITLAYLGRAIERRGTRSSDVEEYAQDLDRMWNTVGALDGGTALPPIELTVGRGMPGSIDLPGLGRSMFSQSVTFVARHSSWGGQVAQSPPRNILSGPSDQDIQRAYAAMAEALREQRAAGNEWFGRRFNRSGLAAVVNTRPDLVAKWITPDPVNPERWNRHLWLGRSFYETLCEVLLEQNPVAGADLYQTLQTRNPAVRIVDDATGIAMLDYALFCAPPTPPVLRLWNHRLEGARTDKDLLELAVLCHGHRARAWLVGTLSEERCSPVPFVRARAILASGFFAVPNTEGSRPPLPSDISDWESDMTKRARLWRLRAEWARGWLERFAIAERDEEANAAFRLFLRCVDTRYVNFVEEALERAAQDRRVFFDANAEDVERAVATNEKDLRENFLGQKVSEGQVWPWFANQIDY